jgi:hypothetical protein
MAATTTAKISSLIEKLQDSELFAHLEHSITFQQSTSFSWQHHTHTVTYDPSDSQAPILLLHEVGHAILDHHDYAYDIHLIEMERAAWDKAQAIAPSLSITIPEQTIEDALDTYRDWLHARSLCPRCGSTGVQDGAHNYTCLACHREWHANEARTCQLRRYHIKKRPR